LMLVSTAPCRLLCVWAGLTMFRELLFSLIRAGNLLYFSTHKTDGRNAIFTCSRSNVYHRVSSCTSAKSYLTLQMSHLTSFSDRSPTF
jgi:hypothetical protein